MEPCSTRLLTCTGILRSSSVRPPVPIADVTPPVVESVRESTPSELMISAVYVQLPAITSVAPLDTRSASAIPP